MKSNTPVKKYRLPPKRRKKRARELSLCDKKGTSNRIKIPLLLSPSVPSREILPRSAKKVVAVSTIDSAALNLNDDEEMDLDEDEEMDARDVADGGDKDTREDAQEESEDVSQLGALNQQEERLLISLHFRRLGSPPPNKWEGRGGTVSAIASAINFTQTQRERIKQVITSTYESLTSGEQYDPSRAPRDPNISAKIKDGSYLQGNIADYIESGLSFSQCTDFINQMLIAKGEVFTVTKSAVYSCAMRMKARVSKIMKRPQGSTDLESAWAKCRYRFVTQLLLRFELDIDITPFLNEDGSIPDCFNKEKLLTLYPALHICAIAFWDVSRLLYMSIAI